MIKLDDNFALRGYTLTTRNTIMACYTAYLAGGETLLCKTIQSNTIQRYLNAAAELSISAKMMNPCFDIMGNQSVCINDILKEVRRWEKMPNRKEPVTKTMVDYIIKKGDSLYGTNPNNIYTALSDWLVLGEQTGFRRKEWAQDRAHLKKQKDAERNIDGSPAAFTLGDFEFRAEGNKRLTSQTDKHIDKAVMVNIRWRYQKNNDNGQVISYVKDNENKAHCAVAACIRIHKRATSLNLDNDSPIAVYGEYKKKKIKVRFIDDVHIKISYKRQQKKFIISHPKMN